LSTSTCWNAIIGGNAEVSTKFSPRSVAAALWTSRRPFTSTSVELTPSPRRFTLLVPVVWFCVNASGLFCEPVLIVSRSITSLILLAPLEARSSADKTTTGDGASNCDGRLMYVPSTIISSAASALRLCASAGAAASAAQTPAQISAPRPIVLMVITSRV
jgi:hypothetical protein